MISVIIFITVSYFRLILAAFEPFIVGGNETSIEEHPFLAHMRFCNKGTYDRACSACGSSILNQKILLTAAHCFDSSNSTTAIIATVGNSNKKLGARYSITFYKVHEDYDKVHLNNDIALAKVDKPLKFGSTVQRIILLKAPVYDQPATVAGWGLINESKEEKSDYLKHLTNQNVWKRENCLKVQPVPLGAFCAGDLHSKNYASRGDSGSPLVIQGITQIGLVSYKTPVMSKSLMVYTDVGYFYNWIVNETRNLACLNE